MPIIYIYNTSILITKSITVIVQCGSNIHNIGYTNVIIRAMMF